MLHAQAVAMGAHPFHHRCLEVYSCLASACRVCAKTGAGCAAMRRAALYGLLQSAAAEAMLAVGAWFHADSSVLLRHSKGQQI